MTGDLRGEFAAMSERDGVIALSGNPYSFTVPSLATSSPSIYAANKLIVTIRPDGSIEYGEGYTPDAAAKAFWDAMGYERTQRVAPSESPPRDPA